MTFRKDAKILKKPYSGNANRSIRGLPSPKAIQRKGQFISIFQTSYCSSPAADNRSHDQRHSHRCPLSEHSNSQELFVTVPVLSAHVTLHLATKGQVVSQVQFESIHRDLFVPGLHDTHQATAPASVGCNRSAPSPWPFRILPPLFLRPARLIVDDFGIGSDQ